MQSSSSGLVKGLRPPLQVEFTWKGPNLGAPEAAPIRWLWNKQKLIWSLQYLIWISSLWQDLNLIKKMIQVPPMGLRATWQVSLHRVNSGRHDYLMKTNLFKWTNNKTQRSDRTRCQVNKLLVCACLAWLFNGHPIKNVVYLSIAPCISMFILPDHPINIQRAMAPRVVERCGHVTSHFDLFPRCLDAFDRNATVRMQMTCGHVIYGVSSVAWFDV